MTKKEYAEAVLDSRSWLGVGTQLLKAAESLRPPGVKDRCDLKKVVDHPGEVYLMLSAFALENLSKAVIVEQKKGKLRAEIEKTGKLPSMLRGHNLVSLLSKLGSFELTDEERNCATRLTCFSVWAGRYPTSVDEASMDVRLTGWCTEEPEVWGLVERVRDLATQEIEKGQTQP